MHHFNIQDLSNNMSQRSSVVDTVDRKALPLIETNFAKKERPVYLKVKALRESVNQPGKIGKAKACLAKFEFAGHWAIEVGDYTHELLNEKGDIQHFRGKWWSEQGTIHEENKWECGSTFMTDTDIDEQARQLIKLMQIRGSEEGTQHEYNVFFNSCQRFARKLAGNITKHSHAAHIRCKTWFLSRTIGSEIVARTANGVAVAGVVYLGTMYHGKREDRKIAALMSGVFGLCCFVLPSRQYLLSRRSYTKRGLLEGLKTILLDERVDRLTR